MWLVGLICLMTASAVAGVPAGGDGLDADIAAVRGKDWFVRATFVGWSDASEAVFRQAECDPDVLGAKGASCSVRLCVASAMPDRAAWPNCPYEGWSLELSDAMTQRAAVAPRDVRASYAQALAKARITKGVSLPRSTFKTAITRETPSKGHVVITPRLRGFAPMVAFQHDASDEGREQRIESVTISDAMRSIDKRCIAVAGYVVFDTYYESVQGTLRVPFAITQCRR